MLAHIAGIPLEETALSFVPIAAVAGGLVALRLRRLAGLLPAQGSGPAHSESATGPR